MEYFSQGNPPSSIHESCSEQDLAVLDKTSLTSVVDFMQKFQEDATFTPPTKTVMFDSEKYDINVDGDEEVLEQFPDIEELLQEE